MMKKFSGGEDKEQKDMLVGGDIFNNVVDDKNVDSNLPLFAFYRCLSKHWHYTSTARKESSLNKLADKLDKTVTQDEIQL